MRNSRRLRRRFHFRQLGPMRDQSVTIECDPFACEVTRFVGKPFKFGPAVINWFCGLPTKRTFPILDGHMNSLVLLQCKGFHRAQYTLLVNRLKMNRHGNYRNGVP